MNKILATCLAIGVMTAGACAQSVPVDSVLPSYKPVQGVSGTVKSIGSDTLNNVMAGWMEGFRKLYPNVHTEMEGKGSSTAPPALIEGQADFGPMSREMKGDEIDKFEKKFGYKPTALRVGVDALAVFVHKDCPINSISLDDLKRVFSVDGPQMTWGDLGVKNPEWASKPISLYGRNSASGTYGYFKEHALGNKDFKATVKEQPGSSGVVQSVASDKYAIGYSGIGYRTADVKPLKIAPRKGAPAIEPTAVNAYSGDYPIARFLLVYVNYKPGSQLDPLRAEFVKMVFSQTGQELVVKDGFYPVTAEMAATDLKTVGLPSKF